MYHFSWWSLLEPRIYGWSLYSRFGEHGGLRGYKEWIVQLKISTFVDHKNLNQGSLCLPIDAHGASIVGLAGKVGEFR